MWRKCWPNDWEEWQHHHHLVTGTKSRTDSPTETTLQEKYLEKAFISNSRQATLAYQKQKTVFKIAIVNNIK